MRTRQKQHLNIKVHGRVQGVFFRQTVRRNAESLGVNGYVRNNPDGSVSIEAEADEGTLKEFLDLCWQGTSKAKVRRLETEPGGLQHFDTFRIV